MAYVTMNRPNRRNALSLEHMKELNACFEMIGESRAVAGVILRGAGPAFCAGHDLSEMVGHDPNFYRNLFDVCSVLMEKIQAIPSPSSPRFTGSPRRPDASSPRPATWSWPPKMPASPRRASRSSVPFSKNEPRSGKANNTCR